MKRIIVTLFYIAAATALAIPSPEQSHLLQAQAQVVIAQPPLDTEPQPEIVWTEKEESTSLDVSPGSCFCTGGALCCEKNGETDCGFGVCGI